MKTELAITILVVWMMLMGFLEGIFYNMRNHDKAYPFNIHWLLNSIRTTVGVMYYLLTSDWLIPVVMLTFMYPLLHDGVLYMVHKWYGVREYRRGFFSNPPTRKYEGKSIFSFRFSVRVLLFLLGVVLIVILKK